MTKRFATRILRASVCEDDVWESVQERVTLITSEGTEQRPTTSSDAFGR